MRASVCGALFAVAALLLLSGTEGYVERTNEDGLKIYIFDVGQAMSQLWVFPSGFTVFVDGPELKWKSDETATLVAGKLEKILKGKKVIDVGVMTHLHLDHVGYATHGGIWALVEEFGYSFNKFVERDSGRWVDANGDGECTADEIVYKNVGTLSGTATHWLCYATDPASKIYPVRETAQLCSTTQIAPPDASAQVTVVAADAQGAKLQDGRPVGGDHRQDELPPSENDYCVGLVLRYGKFTFATFGDLDGEYAQSDYGYLYNNIEATVVKRVGEVDVYNVNHHGSGHSSSALFVNRLRPTFSTISCGEDNSYGHPKQDVLDRLAAVNSTVFLTENGNATLSYGTAVVTNADIVISVAPDTATFTVQSGRHHRTFKSKAAKQPRCTL